MVSVTERLYTKNPAGTVIAKSQSVDSIKYNSAATSRFSNYAPFPDIKPLRFFSNQHSLFIWFPASLNHPPTAYHSEPPVGTKRTSSTLRTLRLSEPPISAGSTRPSAYHQLFNLNPSSTKLSIHPPLSSQNGNQRIHNRSRSLRAHRLRRHDRHPLLAPRAWGLQSWGAYA